MPSITLSRRLLGCLLVILLSQVSNAAKSKHLEQIRTSLNRIETFLGQQDEKNAINCAVPIEKLYALIGDLSNVGGQYGDSNEFRDLSQDVRRALGIDSYVLRQLLKKQRRQSNDFSDSDEDDDDIFNAIANTNANTNMNTNINANQHSRRTLSSKLPSLLTALSSNANKNQNSNLNINSNKNKGRYDGSDESDY